jgi:hemin uptake protein HemP
MEARLARSAARQDQTAPHSSKGISMLNDRSPPTPEQLAKSTADTTSPTGGATATTYLSEALLQGQREVLIRHGEEVYRLRLTKQGKLILYK